MSKGLDLIKRQQLEFIDGFPTGNIYIGVTQEELIELEQELKDYEYLKQSNEELQKLNTNYGKRIDKLEEILEIIKKKDVNIYCIKITSNYKEYNSYVNDYYALNYREEHYLTETEFNLIKEWLTNE